MADTGNGATLTRTGFVREIVAIRIGSQTLEMLDVSTLSSSGFTEKIKADLADAGSISVEVNAVADDTDIDIGDGPTETTITWPMLAGGTNAATLVGTAVLTDKKQPDFENNTVQRETYEFTWDGMTGPAFTIAT